jgi:hypothetical protein
MLMSNFLGLHGLTQVYGALLHMGGSFSHSSRCMVGNPQSAICSSRSDPKRFKTKSACESVPIVGVWTAMPGAAQSG